MLTARWAGSLACQQIQQPACLRAGEIWDQGAWAKIRGHVCIAGRHLAHWQGRLHPRWEAQGPSQVEEEAVPGVASRLRPTASGSSSSNMKGRSSAGWRLPLRTRNAKSGKLL